MKQVSPKDLKYTYSHFHEPVLSVQPGETFIVETEDCFTSLFRTPEGWTPENVRFTEENLDGVTGPIVVEGAEPGDAVAITIEDMEIVTPGSVVMSRYSDPSPQDWWLEEYACKSYEVVDNHLVFDDERSLPVQPLIGCIATAPAREVVFSKMQGTYGGNMDCNEVTAGATVFLPVYTPGAYLYFGDCKALMGDGEIVQPPEVGADLTLRVELLPLPTEMSWPRVLSDSKLVTVVSGISADQAARIAFAEMLAWVEHETDLPREDAALLLGMLAHVGIAQISNALHTSKCTVPRTHLF